MTCHAIADNFMHLTQCSFVEHRNYKIVYRRYASLFFLVGVDNEEVSYSLYYNYGPVLVYCIIYKTCFLNAQNTEIVITRAWSMCFDMLFWYIKDSGKLLQSS